MNLDADLLEIIVCPACHGGLAVDDDAGELVCTACGLAYPVRDGIAVMLESEARPVDSVAASAPDRQPAP